MIAPKVTTMRMPIFSDSQPMKMPPTPAPMNDNDVASVGTDLGAPNSAAMGFSATAASSGPPYATARIASATIAMTQEARLSTLSFT